MTPDEVHVARSTGLTEVIESHPAYFPVFLKGTASEATLVALLAARSRAVRMILASDPQRPETGITSKLVAYSSDQVRFLLLLLLILLLP